MEPDETTVATTARKAANSAISTLTNLFSNLLNNSFDSLKTLAKRSCDETTVATTARKAANSAISTLTNLFSNLLNSTIKLANSTQSLYFPNYPLPDSFDSLKTVAKRSCDEARRFITQKLAEKNGKVKLVAAMAIGYFFIKFFRGGGGKGKMMKPPGRRGGDRIYRSDFEGNPSEYFRDLRSCP